MISDILKELLTIRGWKEHPINNVMSLLVLIIGFFPLALLFYRDFIR